MKNLLSIVLCGSLVAAMLLGMTACGGDDQQAETTNPAATEEVAVTPPSTEPDGATEESVKGETEPTADCTEPTQTETEETKPQAARPETGTSSEKANKPDSTAKKPSKGNSDSGSGSGSGSDNKPTTPPHTHNYKIAVTLPTCTAGGYTIYTCSCGHSYKADYTDPLGHSYGDWVTTKEPTTSAEGEQTRTCSRCGHTETRSVDKLPEPGVTAADIPALESYARSYAQSVGFTIDTSLNLSNAGYYPSWGYNYKSLDHAKSVIREGIEVTKGSLIAADGNDDGFTGDGRYRYNCIIQIDSDGKFVDYHLYG